MGVFKNEVGRPSNEVIKTRRVLKIIGLIVTFCIFFMIGYYAANKFDSNISKDNNKAEENEISENIDVNSNQVIDLFNTMNRFTNGLDVMTDVYNFKDIKYLYSYFYTQDKIVNEDVSDMVKFAIVFDKLYDKKINSLIVGTQEDFDSFRFYLSDINKKSVEIFGTNIDIKNILDSNGNVSVGVRGTAFKYNPVDESFSLMGMGIGDSSSYDIKTKIISAIKYENRIEITNKIMFTYAYIDEQFKIFKNSVKDSYDLKDEIADLSNMAGNISVKDINIDDYLEELNTFKWTFTKNQDGNYIFTSVEKIK